MKQALIKINEALAQALTKHKRCEACGNEFSCGASVFGCWCSEIELTDETRAELRSRYRDCLCRECLASYSISSRGGV
ncbi:MAG TPA: cysteine-rich CWC family protein [Pyrinomonadaceae bacterium]|jgi:hypothetical protein|nr:cysteine-rich CWC family protein [Pyrinomonadaceae bacterium]